MKTIFLKDDINIFLNEVIEEVQAGRNVLISMYGYKALVYKNSVPDKVRTAIKRKLRAIQNLEINLYNLRNYSGLSKEKVESIQNKCTPDEIADICLDLGLILNTKRI